MTWVMKRIQDFQMNIEVDSYDWLLTWYFFQRLLDYFMGFIY